MKHIYLLSLLFAGTISAMYQDEQSSFMLVPESPERSAPPVHCSPPCDLPDAPLVPFLFGAVAPTASESTSSQPLDYIPATPIPPLAAEELWDVQHADDQLNGLLITPSAAKSSQSAVTKTKRYKEVRSAGKYFCEYCTREFRWPWGLKYHRENVCARNPRVKTIRIKCPQGDCEFVTKRKADLARHIETTHLLGKGPVRAKKDKVFRIHIPKSPSDIRPVTRAFAKRIGAIQLPHSPLLPLK